MVDPTLHDTIEKYLLDQLSPAETARLEAAMASDAVLREQVEIQRLALLGMQRLAAAGLSQSFDRWDAQMPPPPAALPRPRARGIKIKEWAWSTVALLLLLTAGTLWHFAETAKARAAAGAGKEAAAARADSLRAEINRLQNRLADLGAGPKPDHGDSLLQTEIRRLAAELDKREKQLRDFRKPAAAPGPIAMRHAPPPPALNLRGSPDDGADAVLEAADAAFRSGKFGEAVRLLRGIPPGDARQAQVARALPYALFYASDFRAAVPAFLKLWETDRFEAEAAQFYLMLCFLGTGDTEAARAMRLGILANPGHRFWGEARRAVF